MKRIAYLSPLPPEASGIADYSAELLGPLQKRYEVHLFSADPANRPSSLADLQASHYRSFPAAARDGGFDAIVYHLGNSADFHGEIYRHALTVPGIVVLHEYMLHHLVRGLSAVGEYIEAMRYAYGDAGTVIARRLLEADHPLESWSYPLFEKVVDRSLGLIVHSETTQRRVLRSRPSARTAVVPHHLSLPDAPTDAVAQRQELRRELGIGEQALVLASFGMVNPAKRIDIVLRAFARFRRRFPESVYVLAGEVSPYYSEVTDLLQGELGDGVIVTGRTPLDQLVGIMNLADIAINLRHPTGGETSGTCMRLLGLGTPVIVSDAGWFGDIPASCSAKVSIGRLEEEELLALMTELAENPELRLAMGRAAARWVGDHHRLDDSAQGYAEFIDRILRDRPVPLGPIPPLAPYPATDLASELVAEVGGAAAELGVSEDDQALLPELARTLVDLGLDPRTMAMATGRPSV